MNSTFTKLDWSLVQSFIAVAENGSLTAAAKEMGVSQPTIGRDIAKIEATLGTQLFLRERHGLVPTESASHYIEAAKEMLKAAAKFSMPAPEDSDQLKGTVRLTASLVMSHFALPDIISKLTREFPNIDIELHATDKSDNLLFHEADIAIRMYRPDQLDIITRHIGEIELGIFASKEYLEKRGEPKSLDDMRNHDWIGYDKSELIIKGMRTFGWQVERDFFKIRCDDQAAYWHLVKAGAGIGVGQVKVAEQSDHLVRLMEEIDIPTIPVWLTANKALKRSKRIRVVYDAIAQELSNYVK